MTSIKNLPVDERELLQWLTAWRANRELAFSAMPDVLFAWLRQEAFIDHEWDITDRGQAFVASMAGGADAVVYNAL